MPTRALVIDLSTRQAREQELPEEYLNQYLGGRGLGARLLHDFVAPSADPLGPDNCLIFVPGPLHATKALYSSKSVLYTKSPQTGITLYSIASGSFCHNLVRCGYQALVITGKAESPTYVTVQDRRVEFRDATKLWGLSTADAEYFIRAKVPSAASVALIGPAGENLVKYACIVTEGRRRQAFGRGGAGAVMGAKNLKAVAVLGTGEVPIHDRGALREAHRSVNALIAANPLWKGNMHRYGTASSVALLNAAGILPSHQWRMGQFEHAAEFDPDRLHESFFLDSESCGPYCPNPCNHWTLVREGEYRGALTNGPEYETIYAFGSNLGNARFDSIIAIDELCDLLGLDTISAGLTIGWAMECAERGLLSEADVDGLDLRFGNHALLPALVRKIAYREGIGDLLAEGSRLAAQRVGGGSEAWAMTSKGLEFGGYECRASWGQALQFALSHRGGCHHDLGLPARRELGTARATTIKGQGEYLKALAAGWVIYDSAVLCAFPKAVLGLEPVSALLSAVTGRDLTVAKLEEIGERILNVERLFVVKAGFGRAHDCLPDRLTKEPLPSGPGAGKVVPLEELKDEWYRAMGWELVTGSPRAETLGRLGIELCP